MGKVIEKIELLETTAANYSIVWNILKKRYDDLTPKIKGFFQRVQNSALSPMQSCTNIKIYSNDATDIEKITIEQ